MVSADSMSQANTESSLKRMLNGQAEATVVRGFCRGIATLFGSSRLQFARVEEDSRALVYHIGIGAITPKMKSSSLNFLGAVPGVHLRVVSQMVRSMTKDGCKVKFVEMKTQSVAWLVVGTKGRGNSNGCKVKFVEMKTQSVAWLVVGTKGRGNSNGSHWMSLHLMSIKNGSRIHLITTTQAF
jgi:hypothetical protein